MALLLLVSMDTYTCLPEHLEEQLLVISTEITLPYSRHIAINYWQIFPAISTTTTAILRWLQRIRVRVTIKWRATQTFPSVRSRKTINAGLDRLWGLHPLSNTAGLWEMLVPRIGAFCLELSLCGWSGQSQLEAPSSLLSFSFSKRRGFSNMTLYRLDSAYRDHMIPRSVNLNTCNEAKCSGWNRFTATAT